MIKNPFLNPGREFKPGDILYAAKNKNPDGSRPHYMIYLEDGGGSNTFIGAMLTRMNGPLNAPLLPEYFKPGHKVVYKKSHVVRNFLLKEIAWAPFEKIGELTDEGVQFVEMALAGSTPMLWKDYLNTSKKINPFT